MYILASDIFVLTEEDDYEKGCVGGHNTYTIDGSGGMFSSIDDLIKHLSEHYCLPKEKKDYHIFDDRLCCSAFVDEDNIEADERDIELWKKGEQRLWIANYSVNISFFEKVDLESDQMQELLGITVEG
jgi:hypothetical protein